MAPRPSAAAAALALLQQQNCQEILRPSRNYGAAADENSFPSPGVMHSCTGVRSLLSNLHSLAKWRLLTYFATDWPPSCWSCWWCW